MYTPLNPIAVPNNTMAATLKPLQWSLCFMQASRIRSTSSWSRLVAWKPSLKGSLSGPVQRRRWAIWGKADLQLQEPAPQTLWVTYSGFCCSCKSCAASWSDESAFAERLSIGWRNASLQLPATLQQADQQAWWWPPIRVQVEASNECHTWSETKLCVPLWLCQMSVLSSWQPCHWASPPGRSHIL